VDFCDLLLFVLKSGLSKHGTQTWHRFDKTPGE
jgi:hypothetical protein